MVSATTVDKAICILKSFLSAKKKDKQSAAAIFFVQQQKLYTPTLLDGIGTSENNNTSIVIESSG